ncbi:MAG: hypothetical protein JWR61_1507 [Ferruginibacter sp.]|nr:hypothetical protein [Ferruginibacter sp.]
MQPDIFKNKMQILFHHIKCGIKNARVVKDILLAVIIKVPANLNIHNYDINKNKFRLPLDSR